MKITIKNMVCDRCCLVVSNILKDLNLQARTVVLGEVDFGDVYGEQLASEVQVLLTIKLEEYGFELLNNKKSKLIETIKIACIDYIQRAEEFNKEKLSSHISKALKRDYNYLSQLFSGVEGVTIEQYFIRLRIEKVKELLVYDEFKLSEIAFQLGYSSVAHLSGQFKKVTGLTPSHFRSLKNEKKRHSIDKL